MCGSSYSDKVIVPEVGFIITSLPQAKPNIAWHMAAGLKSWNLKEYPQTHLIQSLLSFSYLTQVKGISKTLPQANSRKFK